MLATALKGLDSDLVFVYICIMDRTFNKLTHQAAADTSFLDNWTNLMIITFILDTRINKYLTDTYIWERHCVPIQIRCGGAARRSKTFNLRCFG